jgi:SAM-dependent methyltransferase
MSEVFDSAAKTYDNDFTNTKIGKSQRNQVWKYVNNYIEGKKNLKILELNCGTGVDAVHFASLGHCVTATDISLKMLEKAKQNQLDHQIDFRVLDIAELNDDTFKEQNFDLIFSNFGGLNCLNSESLDRLGRQIPKLLSSQGTFIAVVMPKWCLWEMVYLTLKGQFRNAFRRNRDYAMAHVSGEFVKTWYYSPKQFKHLMGVKLKKEEIRPIGFFVPPSYMEHFFSKWTSLYSLFHSLEENLSKFAWQAAFSDHFYIQFKVR